MKGADPLRYNRKCGWNLSFWNATFVANKRTSILLFFYKLLFLRYKQHIRDVRSTAVLTTIFFQKLILEIIAKFLFYGCFLLLLLEFARCDLFVTGLIYFLAPKWAICGRPISGKGFEIIWKFGNVVFLLLTNVAHFWVMRWWRKLIQFLFTLLSKSWKVGITPAGCGSVFIISYRYSLQEKCFKYGMFFINLIYKKLRT